MLFPPTPTQVHNGKYFSVYNMKKYIHTYIHVLSCAQLFATPWTVAHQAPLVMEFSQQEYWSELPFPPPGDLPDSGTEPTSLVSPALADKFFTTVPGYT